LPPDKISPPPKKRNVWIDATGGWRVTTTLAYCRQKASGQDGVETNKTVSVRPCM